MMKALIAAGGKGTRLRPITYSMNKHRIPVANKPMIFYALEKVAEAGITDVAININEGDAELPAAVGDGSRWGVRITYIEQRGGALGLAHIIKNAQQWLGNDSFVFYLGDNIILGSIAPFVHHFQQIGAQAYLALSKVPDPQRFGVPEINEKGDIVRVIEKPSNPPSSYAVTGIYCYDASIHEAVNNIQPSKRGELEISDAHTYLIEHGRTVKYEIVEGWWKDTGKPEDLLECNRLLLDSFPVLTTQPELLSSVRLEGAVHCGEGVKVTGLTSITGPVVIGDHVTIEDSTILPYSSIGSGTHIRKSTVGNSIIMDEALLDSVAITESIIGHNAHIQTSPAGQTAHSLFIGENSIINL